MDKKTWDQSHTVQSNKAQQRERITAGNPDLKTKGLEREDVRDKNGVKHTYE